jgi:hypothetical protein
MHAAARLSHAAVAARAARAISGSGVLRRAATAAAAVKTKTAATMRAAVPPLPVVPWDKASANSVRLIGNVGTPVTLKVLPASGARKATFRLARDAPLSPERKAEGDSRPPPYGCALRHAAQTESSTARMGVS